MKHWSLRHRQHWKRLEELLARSEHLKKMPPADIREMGMLYRGTVHDLARIRSTSEALHLEPYLNALVHKGHARVYVRPPDTWSRGAHFFLTRFPAVFRKNIGYVAASFAVFILGALTAAGTVHFYPATESFFLPPSLISMLDHGQLWMDRTAATPSESSFLMTNNIRVAIHAFVYGIPFGFGTLAILFQNGMAALGGPMTVCFRHGMGLRLLNFIVAHGILELTTIFIAGGAGMMIGFSLLFPGRRKRRHALQRKASEALVLILGCFPLLVLAGLIEGLVSLNRQVGFMPRVLIAAASAFFLIGYLGFFNTSPKKTP